MEKVNRWQILPRTSSSGKALFLCRCCGRQATTPDKSCAEGWPNRSERYHCSEWPEHTTHALARSELEHEAETQLKAQAEAFRAGMCVYAKRPLSQDDNGFLQCFGAWLSAYRQKQKL
jgi:hypothetical protein